MTEPTDAEIAACIEAAKIKCVHPDAETTIEIARAVLAKWGQPQAGASGEPVDWIGASSHHLLAPPPQAVREPLTEARILEVVGLAPDRKVCASTCMTVKFDKKPCQCYPTSASRSEVVAIARAVESAHGITKGGRHGPA